MYSIEEGFRNSKPVYAAVSVLDSNYKVELVRKVEDTWDRRRLALWVNKHVPAVGSLSKNIFREMIKFI